jgi:Ser/Thr protein kinase RdoA (MazF antagonist)
MDIEQWNQLRKTLPYYKTESKRVITSLIANYDTFMNLWKQQENEWLIHGDISFTNIIVKNENAIYLLDWDECNSGMRLNTDLVQLFWRIAWPSGNYQEVMGEYQKQCPLSPDELRIFPMIASSIHIYSYCAKRLKEGKITQEEADIAETILYDAERTIEAPWACLIQ